MPRTPNGDRRVIVLFGKDKQNQNTYSRMLNSVAEFYGFTKVSSIPKREKSGRTYYLRGNKGTASIQVPSGAKTPKGHPQLFSIPIPPSATIGKIESFLAKATKNKPDYFITKDGQSFPIGQQIVQAIVP